MKEVCGNCKYCGGTYAGIINECRYFPPVYVGDYQRGTKEGMAIFMSPTVENDNWCGQFKAI